MLMEVIVLVVVGVIVVVGPFVMGLVGVVVEGGGAIVAMVMLVGEGVSMAMMMVVRVAMLFFAVFVGMFVLMVVIVGMAMFVPVFAVAHGVPPQQVYEFQAKIGMVANLGKARDCALQVSKPLI